MSAISRRIIDAVKAHLNECGDLDGGIPMEGDLESEIDDILLDAIYPSKPSAETAGS